MSTLVVVEEVLREKGTPMVVREIVQAAGERLPSKSKTPDTVVARDLAMDIKRNGLASKFTRVSPGKYTLRELVVGPIDNLDVGMHLAQAPQGSTLPIADASPSQTLSASAS